LRKKQGLTSGWSELVGADGHSVGSCVQQGNNRGGLPLHTIPSAWFHSTCHLQIHIWFYHQNIRRKQEFRMST
jgi:hypothetical protein